MIFHLVLNSLIVFIILTFLIDVCLTAFKINNARVRYMCRLLPILKFPFDLLVFTFYGENLFVNFNPFSCQVYMQDFITSIASLQVRNELAPNEHLIIPQYLSTFIPSSWLNIVVCTIIFVSLLIVLRKLYLFFCARSYLKSIFHSSSPCNRPILNSNLLNKLEQRNVLVLTSDEVRIPFAANLRYIFLPRDLVEELSQDEFEAVIVHELEHLCWKDPILKMASDLICAFCWWLPSRWWLKRLELEQEDACDAGVSEYGIDVCALATAMIKVVKKAKYLNYQFSAVCPFDSPKNNHIRRLEKILNRSNQSGYSWRHLIAIVACASTTFCFWLC